MNRDINQCPLCKQVDYQSYFYGEGREYLHCQVCDLVYVPFDQLVTAEEERAKYDNHQNTPENDGYRNFLNRLLDPLSNMISPNASGLDFGCGPGPTLSIIMQEHGFTMDIYDIFYQPNPDVFDKKYDFITATEVIEHLHHPLDEIQRLWDMIEPGGVLGLMTAFRPDQPTFQTWYYKRDLTHIRFFTPQTFDYLAETLNAKLEIPRTDVILLSKGE